MFVFAAFIEYSVVATLACRHKDEVARKNKTQVLVSYVMLQACERAIKNIDSTSALTTVSNLKRSSIETHSRHGPGQLISTPT